MEEQIEQNLRRYAIIILAKVSKWALKQNGKILRKIGAQLQYLIYKQLHEGKISEKTLQREYGNIHQTKPIAKQDLKIIEQSLKKSGIAYAVEKTPVQEGHEPTYIIHFRGEDLAHMAHAINRAADQLQHDINVLPTPPEKTTAQEQQTQDAPTQTLTQTKTYTENLKEDPKKTINKTNPKAVPNKINQKNVLDKLNKKTEKLKAQQTAKPPVPVKNRIR